MVQFSQSPQHPCRRFFRFESESSFSACYLVVLQHCCAGTDTFALLCIPIQFGRIDIREDANTHKVTFQIVSARFSKNSASYDFCL